MRDLGILGWRRYRVVFVSIVVALGLARPPDAHPAAGDLDLAFGVNGTFVAALQTSFPGERAWRIALDHLQRPILAATVLGPSQENVAVAVLRLTTGGDLDPTFNPTGTTPGILTTGFGSLLCPDGTNEGPALAGLAVTADHHIVLAANLCVYDDKSRIGLVRVDEHGAFDADFDGDGRLVTDLAGTDTYPCFVEDVAVDATGRIYLAGGHCIAGPSFDCQSVNAIVARLTSGGVRDVTYNPAGAIPGVREILQAEAFATTRFRDLTLLSGGRVVAAGLYEAPSVGYDAFVARLDADGTLDTDFGPTGTPPGTVHSGLGKPGAGMGPGGGMALAEAYGVVTTGDDDTAVLVTGQISANTGASFVLAKLDATGALDATFASAAATPGAPRIPNGYRGARLLAQPDGKIVAIGFGPTAGMSPTNQIVVARFEANGTLDPTFGAGGTVATPLGTYAVASDGALQSDGKILVGGMRATSGNPFWSPFGVRYLGDDGPGGTPTPTATPIDLPGEICANCIDDEPDGRVDRDDPECAPRADGGGQGLGTPAPRGKAIARCAKGLETAGAKFAAAKLSRLQHCVRAAFACRQLKPGDAACTDKTARTCAKSVAAIAKDRVKLSDAVAKACGAPAVAFADVLALAGIGYGSEIGPCAEVGVGTLATLADLTTCVRLRHECGAERLLAMQVPRAGELLLAGGRDPAVDAPCVPAAALAGGVADRGRAKLAVKCQAAVAKVGGKLAAGRQKAAHACVQAVTVCLQEKSVVPGCLPSARTKCAKQLGGIESDAAIRAAAVAKACGALDPVELGGADGLGYQAREAECLALGAPGVASAAAVADCLERQHSCRVAELLETTTPRLRELLDLGQVGLP